MLDQLKQKRGAPKVLFCGNGAELTGQMMDLWAYKNGVKIDFARPGKATHNAFCESFNGSSVPSVSTRTGSAIWKMRDSSSKPGDGNAM